EPSVLLEGVRVLEARLRLGRVADVGEERRRADIERPGDERLAPVGGDRLAVHRGGSVLLEGPEPDAVRLVLALEQQARRRVEQPKGRLDLAGPAGHAE